MKNKESKRNTGKEVKLLPVILDTDVSKIFIDSKSVNSALRHLIAALPKKSRKAA